MAGRTNDFYPHCGQMFFIYESHVTFWMNRPKNAGGKIPAFEPVVKEVQKNESR
jgi:hypothetical protein